MVECTDEFVAIPYLASPTIIVRPRWELVESEGLPLLLHPVTGRAHLGVGLQLFSLKFPTETRRIVVTTVEPPRALTVGTPGPRYEARNIHDTVSQHWTLWSRRYRPSVPYSVQDYLFRTLFPSAPPPGFLFHCGLDGDVSLIASSYDYKTRTRSGYMWKKDINAVIAPTGYHKHVDDDREIFKIFPNPPGHVECIFPGHNTCGTRELLATPGDDDYTVPPARNNAPTNLGTAGVTGSTASADNTEFEDIGGILFPRYEREFTPLSNYREELPFIAGELPEVSISDQRLTAGDKTFLRGLGCTLMTPRFRLSEQEFAKFCKRSYSEKIVLDVLGCVTFPFYRELSRTDKIHINNIALRNGCSGIASQLWTEKAKNERERFPCRLDMLPSELTPGDTFRE